MPNLERNAKENSITELRDLAVELFDLSSSGHRLDKYLGPNDTDPNTLLVSFERAARKAAGWVGQMNVAVNHGADNSNWEFSDTDAKPKFQGPPSDGRLYFEAKLLVRSPSATPEFDIVFGRNDEWNGILSATLHAVRAVMDSIKSQREGNNERELEAAAK